MQIKQVTSQLGRDFCADMECEHCGHQSKLIMGYDDNYYRQKVIPAMTCGSCGKNRSGEVPVLANRAGEVPVPAAPHDISRPTGGT